MSAPMDRDQSNRPTICCTKCQFAGEPTSVLNEASAVCPRCGYLCHVIDAWPGSVTVWALAPLDWTPVQQGKPLDERFEAVRNAVRSVLKKDPIIVAAIREAQSLLGQFERDELTDSQAHLCDAVEKAGLL